MRLTVLTCLILSLALPLCASAETPLDPDASLDTVLDALNARGKDLKDFSADVALHTADNRTGEDSAQIGKVVYDAANGNSRIKVSFDKKWLDRSGVCATGDKPCRSIVHHFDPVSVCFLGCRHPCRSAILCDTADVGDE